MSEEWQLPLDRAPTQEEWDHANAFIVRMRDDLERALHGLKDVFDALARVGIDIPAHVTADAGIIELGEQRDDALAAASRFAKELADLRIVLDQVRIDRDDLKRRVAEYEVPYSPTFPP
jgi:hypothetical protein